MKSLGVRFYLPIIILTVVLSLPRFAHHTPDSVFYVQVAKYFRGEFARTDLFVPYAFRILIPWFAALIPLSDLDINIALINLLSTVIAYFVFSYYLQQFTQQRAQLNLGVLILVVSFPSLNYSSAVLTDAGGFLILVIASVLLLRKRYYWFGLAVSIGVLVRDPLLTLIPVFLLWIALDKEIPWKKRLNFPAVLVVIFPLLIYWVLRMYFSGLDGYYRPFAIDNVILNLTDPISWVTLILTILPSFLLFFIGIYRSGFDFIHKMEYNQVRLLMAITIVQTVILFIGIGGRYVWPLYMSLIPAAILASEGTAVNRFLCRIADLVFGTEQLTPRLDGSSVIFDPIK